MYNDYLYTFEELTTLPSTPSAQPTFLEQLNAKSHKDQCNTSCYQCIRRYGNRSHHELLDWRLGLAVLELFHNPDFRCGLDGDFSHPSIEDWRERLTEKLNQVSERLNALGIASVGHHIDEPADIVIPYLQVNEDVYWFGHPLWDDRNMNLSADTEYAVHEMYDELSDDYNVIFGTEDKPINAFTLFRSSGLIMDYIYLEQTKKSVYTANGNPTAATDGGLDDL